MASRRDFVRGQVNEVSAPLALGALNNRWALADQADFNSDVDVLNYALTLEYLEAAFYNQGTSVGLLSGQAKTYLDKVRDDENFHVKAITATIKKLGGTPVQAPKVAFGDAFDTKKKFLTTSHTFENVGVGAYLGAAGFIKNKAVLQAAAGIFGVEARHAAIVGNLLGLKPNGTPSNPGVYAGAFEKPLTKATVLKDVAPFLVGAGGASPSQMGKMPSGGVNTGGGSTSGVQDKALLAAGGAALLGAGAAAYATKKGTRTAEATANGENAGSDS